VAIASAGGANDADKGTDADAAAGSTDLVSRAALAGDVADLSESKQQGSDAENDNPEQLSQQQGAAAGQQQQPIRWMDSSPNGHSAAGLGNSNSSGSSSSPRQQHAVPSLENLAMLSTAELDGNNQPHHSYGHGYGHNNNNGDPNGTPRSTTSEHRLPPPVPGSPRLQSGQRERHGSPLLLRPRMSPHRRRPLVVEKQIEKLHPSFSGHSRLSHSAEDAKLYEMMRKQKQKQQMDYEYQTLNANQQSADMPHFCTHTTASAPKMKSPAVVAMITKKVNSNTSNGIFGSRKIDEDRGSWLSQGRRGMPLDDDDE
jgi:hypothetical protein